jgi:hypothetical protein
MQASPPAGVDRDLANEALCHLRAALEKSDAARVAAEKMADRERAMRKEIEAHVSSSKAEVGSTQLSMQGLLARCIAAERQARLCQLLCDRQTTALQQLAAENASLLVLLSGLPSLRSAVANGAAPLMRASTGSLRAPSVVGSLEDAGEWPDFSQDQRPGGRPAYWDGTPDSLNEPRMAGPPGSSRR